MNARTRAKNKYNKVNTRTYCLRLNLKTDKDIIEYLDRLHYGGETKQGKIKELIRKEIAEDERLYQEYLDD